MPELLLTLHVLVYAENLIQGVNNQNNKKSQNNRWDSKIGVDIEEISRDHHLFL